MRISVISVLHYVQCPVSVSSQFSTILQLLVFMKIFVFLLQFSISFAIQYSPLSMGEQLEGGQSLCKQSGDSCDTILACNVPFCITAIHLYSNTPEIQKYSNTPEIQKYSYTPEMKKSQVL